MKFILELKSKNILKIGWWIQHQVVQVQIIIHHIGLLPGGIMVYTGPSSLYTDHYMTGLYQTWYLLYGNILEAFSFSRSCSKYFQLWQACEHSTMTIAWPILTKFEKQLVCGKILKPIYFQGHKSKVKFKNIFSCDNPRTLQWSLCDRS